MSLYKYNRVDLSPLMDLLLDNFSLREIIAHIGEGDVIDEINPKEYIGKTGSSEVMNWLDVKDVCEHFDLVKAEEISEESEGLRCPGPGVEND